MITVGRGAKSLPRTQVGVVHLRHATRALLVVCLLAMVAPIEAIGGSLGPGDVTELELKTSSRTDSAAFSTTGQGLWGSSSRPTDVSVDLLSRDTAKWNITSKRYNPTKGFTHWVSGATKDAANWFCDPDPKWSCSIGADLNASTNGWVEIGAGLGGFTGGSADLRYSVNRTMDYPAANTFWHGDTVSIESAWTPGSDSKLVLTPLTYDPQLEFGADLGARLTGSVDYAVGSRSFSVGGNLSDLVPTETTLGLSDTEIIQELLADPKIAPHIEEYIGLKSFVMRGPKGTAVTSGPMDAVGALKVNATDKFVNLDVDVDTLLMFIKDLRSIKKLKDGNDPDKYTKIAKKLKGMGGGLTKNVGVGPISAELVIADIDTLLSLTSNQTLEFGPEVKVRYDFDHDVILDGKATRSITRLAGQSVAVTFPGGLEDPITVTPTLLVTGSVKQKYRVLANHNTEIIAGKGHVAVSSQEIWPAFTVFAYPTAYFCGGCIPVTGGCLGHYNYDDVRVPAFRIPGIPVGTWGYGPALGPWNPGKFEGDVAGGTPLAGALASTVPISFNKQLASFKLDPQVKPYAVPLRTGAAPYAVDEGSILTVDGSGSYDLDGDTIRHYWDFDYDGQFEVHGPVVPYSDPAGVPYSVDGPAVQPITLMANDAYGYRTSGTNVTVRNVPPTGSLDNMEQPNQNMILPIVHELTFTGSYLDPGFVDTHEVTWDFGDGSVVPGTVLAEENAYPLATGVSSARHVYSRPGVYTVTMTVVDDDGGTHSDTTTVTVISADDAMAYMADYIWAAPGSAFAAPARNRQAALCNMIATARNLDAQGRSCYGASYLTMMVRPRTDGSVGGHWRNDWITSAALQGRMVHMIDDIAALMRLNARGL